MKFICLATLLASVQSVKLTASPDHPESTQVFSYWEGAKSSAGFVQLSAC